MALKYGDIELTKAVPEGTYTFETQKVDLREERTKTGNVTRAHIDLTLEAEDENTVKVSLLVFSTHQQQAGIVERSQHTLGSITDLFELADLDLSIREDRALLLGRVFQASLGYHRSYPYIFNIEPAEESLL